MSEKVVIFGGTGAGAKIAELLADKGVPARLCAAAGFSAETPETRGTAGTMAKRAGKDDIAETIARCELVIDATHPYAREMRENIREACENAGIERIRLEPDRGETDGVTEAESAKQAVELLNKTGEKALLAVGIRELPEFTRVKDYRNRLFARVQPTPEAVAKCVELGFAGNHIIGMQGPFTREMNAATLRMLGAACLVTKDSGRASGLFEKLEAARQTGCRLILIRQPVKEEKGLDFEQVRGMLAERYGFSLSGDTEPQLRPRAEKRQPFPLFVNLDGRRAVIIGAGSVAYRRARTLLKFGAEITAVAPEACAEMRELAGEGRAEWIQAEFSPDHLGRAEIAVAATNSRDANRAVGETAKRMKILVNVSDSREESTFIFPAVVQNENIVAGVVTAAGDNAPLSGVASAVDGVAQKLREKLGGLL